jgi:hypothetical protein
MRWNIRTPLLAGLLLLIGGAGAVVAAGQIGNSDSQQATVAAQAPVENSPADPGSVTSIPMAIKTSFGVFRRARTSADSMPAHGAGTLQGHDGTETSFSRAVASSPQGAQYYLTPGQSDVCLTTGSGSGGCFEASDAAAGAFTVSLCERDQGTDELRIAGVVGDSVDGVAIKLANGALVPATLGENAFVVDVARTDPAALPEAVVLSSASGRHERPLAVPPGMAALPCG